MDRNPFYTVLAILVILAAGFWLVTYLGQSPSTTTTSSPTTNQGSSGESSGTSGSDVTGKANPTPPVAPLDPPPTVPKQ